MPEPNWILEDVVSAVHKRQIAEHGGAEGVRDVNLLLSALAKPRNLYNYSDSKPDISAMAASYAYGIARNHPFVDGNKRTALVVCRLFLKLNGVELTITNAEKYHIFMRLAAGKLSKEKLANWMRTNSWFSEE